jgi:putative two-component system response regulator
MEPHEITGFGSGRRVLVVEPDRAVRSLVTTYLTKEGLEVLEASDSETATRRLETEPDLVIVSLGQDAPDGIRLVAGVKARWANTPVVALADPQSPDLVTEALASGADRYLFKPFPMAELGQSLDALLRLRVARLQSWEARQWSSDFPAAVRDHLEQALDRLVAAAEARETGAAGRSQRAAALARVLAESVNAVVPEVEVDPPSVAFAAQLMGIGRTAVSEELLQRDGALSPDELSEVRMAARRGAAMLESLCLPPVVVGAVRWHDIRWDGEGQTEVLGGRAIPLEARILGIVWSLEAMTRDRPYRGAMSWSEAVEEITKNMGHRFDPGLSEAFHEALPRLEKVIEKGLESNRAEAPEEG